VEQKVLGFLIDPNWGGPSAVYYALAVGLTPDDFYYTEHQRLFNVIVILTKQGYQFHKDWDITNPYPLIINLYSKLYATSEPLPEGSIAGLAQYLLYLHSQIVAPDVFFDAVKTLKQSANDRKLVNTLVRVLDHYQKHGEWDGALEQITQALLPTLQPHLAPIYSLEDLWQLPVATEFLWEPFLRTDGITLLVGPAGIGKSLLALWIGIHIAQGLSLFGFKTQQTTVLYVDGESNETQTKSRITQFLSSPITNFNYVAFSGDLFHIANYAAFVHFVQQIKPGLIILDSLIRFHTLDENKSSDMKRLAHFFRDLITRFQTAFLLLHHTRKTTPFGTISDVVRGSTELRAFPDTVLILRRPKGSTEMTVDVDKCRDSHELNQSRFRIRLNTSDTPWNYEFLGFTEDTDSQMETAMRLITQLLEISPMNRKEIVEKLRSEGISKPTTERALRELKSLGKVVASRAGRQTIYALPSQPEQPHIF